MSNPTLPILFVLTLSLSQALPVVAESFEDSAVFRSKNIAGAGSANVTYPYGGAYVYSEPTSDGRRVVRPFTLGKAQRTNFDYFFDQEEEALWAHKESSLQPPLVVSKVRAARFAPPVINWPRVVVKGEEVCVPELSFAIASDWQDHLTCWSKGEGAR